MAKYEYPKFTLIVREGLVPLAQMDFFPERAGTRVDVTMTEDLNQLALVGLLLAAASSSHPPVHMQVKLDAMMAEINATLNSHDTDIPF